jgi:hypothetical protein
LAAAVAAAAEECSGTGADQSGDKTRSGGAGAAAEGAVVGTWIGVGAPARGECVAALKPVSECLPAGLLNWNSF